jgi:hypothetical protein
VPLHFLDPGVLPTQPLVLVSLVAVVAVHNDQGCTCAIALVCIKCQTSAVEPWSARRLGSVHH